MKKAAYSITCSLLIATLLSGCEIVAENESAKPQTDESMEAQSKVIKK